MNLIASDDLKVNSENDVLKCVQNYINHCEIMPDNPEKEEDE